ncbi:NAD(P) transhydrogenase subunit alpha [Sphingomicrobium astaxanthinifaciens]|uniref:NAD(P) transhydrogenase subunit alpha n=1 Tax=Sphingomicrobium astaxanthinifaciens TaxID=1227949 RepID=UPI001FCB381C|nr:NAD(P) transhydrogenase subunit alpha [Sphingomicrobium astaxanthinifaciens]MCJ7420327.1 NAD(P) transhydrogenase subunit alpha [Sphingomicrobium astaxanthinifaciens]
MTKVAVLKEGAAEPRVAAIPETVRKLAGKGYELLVERGAGERAGFEDTAYEAAGARLVTRPAAVSEADVLLVVTGPDPSDLKGAKKGARLVGALSPATRGAEVGGYAGLGLEALAMEWMPRITRAQSMDILSSQSNLAGYKAVIDAAALYQRAFPMMMTAAGTVSPAKLFVMGVGVAGLQAIATAKRLGAQVSATDVRSATREQILSLGAKPIFVEAVEGIEGEGQGGYAGETSEEYKKAQAALVSEHIGKQDVVITTALIPGRPAPRLISDAQLATMKPGSVIVDLAAEAGGNVEGCVAGEVTERHGVRIIGAVQLARSLAGDAAALYSRNIANFLLAFTAEPDNAESDSPATGGLLSLPDDDEIVAAIRLTRDGAIVHERLRAMG